MHDPIGAALVLLDVEAPKKGVESEVDPIDNRRRAYVVPTMDGRKQLVQAAPIRDPMFGERLDLFSICMRDVPPDGKLLTGLLTIAREFRRVRLCVFGEKKPQLAVIATFIPEEIHDQAGPRLLHALREVAAVADSLERQLTGAKDVE
jgi:hypothetical protein